MRLLLDTQLLLWAAYTPQRLSPAACAMIKDEGNDLAFSPASLWEVVIKRALSRPDFRIDPRVHTLAVDLLPPLHKDPFDRLLVA